MVTQKTWYQSKTVWGALVALLAIMANQLGFNITGELQAQVIDLILNGTALLGTAISIYGRVKAASKIVL